MANAIEDGIEKVCRSPTCENVKLVIGSIAVFLLIVVLLIGVGSGYSVLKLPPPANFVLLFFALVLLAYVEALHYACVAIEKWDMEKYTDKYPRAVQVHSYVNTPEKVQKFLVGRQFFVIFIVFLIAEITTFPGKTLCAVKNTMLARIMLRIFHQNVHVEFPKNFAGMPELFVIIIIRIGLPGVALTLNVGQLVRLQFRVLLCQCKCISPSPTITLFIL